MVEEDKAEDETIHVKYPERVCYVCGRTEEDLKILFNGKIKELDLRTKTLENEIKKYAGEDREYLFKMLKDTEESNYLELKVETIKTDPSKFGETIPRLDDLLRFKKNDKESLSEIRDRIGKSVKNSDDFEIYEAVQLYEGRLFSWGNTINGMKKEIDKLGFGKKECGLKECTIDFKDLYGGVFDYYETENEFYDKLCSGGITVYICPICAAMFSRASQAAYDVIYSGYGDD